MIIVAWAVYLPEGTFELSEGDWKEDPVPGVLGGGGRGEVRLLVRQEDRAHHAAALQAQEHLVGRIAVGQTHLNTVLGRVCDNIKKSRDGSESSVCTLHCFRVLYALASFLVYKHTWSPRVS